MKLRLVRRSPTAFAHCKAAMRPSWPQFPGLIQLVARSIADAAELVTLEWLHATGVSVSSLQRSQIQLDYDYHLCRIYLAIRSTRLHHHADMTFHRTAGVSVSSLQRSQIRVDPDDLPEAQRLRSWYDTEGHSAATTAVGEGLANAR